MGGRQTFERNLRLEPLFLIEWLDSRRVRPNTLDGYRAALKPVIDHLGTVPLQHLDTPHLDELVMLRLTGEPIAQRDKRGRRSAEVLAYLRSRPEGAGYSDLLATFGEPGIKALDRLVSSGDVLRPAARTVRRCTGHRTRASESARRRE